MVNYLYIHIPFCITKCIYCDFFSVPYDEGLALRYIGSVIKELDFRRDSLNDLKTVYIGGGTPTVIPTLALIRLLKKIRDSFTLAPDAEVTVEANPGTINREKVKALSDSGMNRLSIGVQSFDDKELKFLGRIHTFADALKAIAAVREAAIRNLSIDLIYGIPGQTLEAWTHNVAKASELSPEHISAYELTPEKGTPLYGFISRKEIEKPDEETIIQMYYRAVDTFTEAGYRHYEISNFAKPGFECRHNLNYWDRGEYVGLGAGAHSFIGDRRIRNVGNVGKYIEMTDGGALPVDESIEVSGEDAIKEFIFLGLRKTEGLDIRMFKEDLAIDVLEASEELIEEGLLESDGVHVKLTRKGIVVSNAVIRKLFEKLSI